MGKRDPLVDGDELLQLTAALGAARDRVEAANVSDEQRSRWQRAIGAIAAGASTDLTRALQQLRRFEGTLDRAGV